MHAAAMRVIICSPLFFSWAYLVSVTLTNSE